MFILGTVLCIFILFLVVEILSTKRLTEEQESRKQRLIGEQKTLEQERETLKNQVEDAEKNIISN